MVSSFFSQPLTTLPLKSQAWPTDGNGNRRRKSRGNECRKRGGTGRRDCRAFQSPGHFLWCKSMKWCQKLASVILARFISDLWNLFRMEEPNDSTAKTMKPMKQMKHVPFQVTYKLLFLLEFILRDFNVASEVNDALEHIYGIIEGVIPTTKHGNVTTCNGTSEKSKLQG